MHSSIHTDKRARSFGIAPGFMTPGKLNAITDVRGVRVGHITLDDPEKNMFTGVTAILPHGGNLYRDKVPAGFFQGNGYGKMIGISQIVELGEIETPILLTNTLNVPDAAIGIIEWTIRNPENHDVVSLNPVVGETNDNRINDVRKRFVSPEHAIAAIEIASDGPVKEGNIGAGAGSIAFGYKAGIGTSSRVIGQSSVGASVAGIVRPGVSADRGGYTVGVLVQSNYGGDLHILGVPVGRILQKENEEIPSPDGSVMVVVATDAPLSDRNLSRLAKRAILGIGRTGGNMADWSGDYVVAFSTAEAVRRTGSRRRTPSPVEELPNRAMTDLFSAVIEATEEAVYNSLFAAESKAGIDGKLYEKIPLERIIEILKSHRQII